MGDSRWAFAPARVRDYGLTQISIKSGVIGANPWLNAPQFVTVSVLYKCEAYGLTVFDVENDCGAIKRDRFECPLVQRP